MQFQFFDSNKTDLDQIKRAYGGKLYVNSRLGTTIDFEGTETINQSWDEVLRVGVLIEGDIKTPEKKANWETILMVTSLIKNNSFNDHFLEFLGTFNNVNVSFDKNAPRVTILGYNPINHNGLELLPSPN